jgi:hypothetical protein
VFEKVRGVVVNMIDHKKKEFDKYLYDILNDMDESYRDKIDITSYPKKVDEFKRMIASNWIYFKLIADQTIIQLYH